VGTPPNPNTAGSVPAATADPEREPGLDLAQVFLESAEFSHRADALALPTGTRPNVGDVDVQITIGISQDESSGFIRLAVATNSEQRPIYSLRLSMVALVTRQLGKENMSPREYLQRAGLSLLFPFVREAVGNLTMRGRFGPVWLNPINTKLISDQLAMQPVQPVGAQPFEPEERGGTVVVAPTPPVREVSATASPPPPAPPRARRSRKK